MKKHTLCIIALITLLAPCKNALAMKYANTGLKYGVMAGYAGWLTKRKIDNNTAIGNQMIAQALPAQQESEQFVREVLAETYPELKHHTIKVINVPQVSFATAHVDGIDYVVIPFTDKELEEALRKKNISTDQQLQLTNKEATSNPEHAAALEYHGKAASSTTLDTWKATLLHEGSHVVHNDCKNRALAELPPVFIILAATQLINKKLALVPISIAISQLPTAICKWQEYRADQDVINRAQSPEHLKAMSKWVGNMPTENMNDFIQEFKKINDSSLDDTSRKLLYVQTAQKLAHHLLDPHPANATRAAYFARAAHEIEQKQAADKN